MMKFSLFLEFLIVFIRTGKIYSILFVSVNIIMWVLACVNMMGCMEFQILNK